MMPQGSSSFLGCPESSDGGLVYFLYKYFQIFFTSVRGRRIFSSWVSGICSQEVEREEHKPLPLCCEVASPECPIGACGRQDVALSSIRYYQGLGSSGQGPSRLDRYVWC